MSTLLREPERHRVSSAELVRNISFWQERAIERPVVVTYHGRDRLVLGPISILAEPPRELPPAGLHPAETTALLRSYMHECYIFWSRDLRIHDVNTACEIYLGKTREQLIGHTWEEVMNSPMPQILSDAIESVFAGGEPVHMEFDSLAVAGRRVQARYYSHPQGAVGLFTNITAQWLLAQRLHRAEATITSLETHPDIGQICIDAFGRITACSSTVLGWTQLEWELVRGKMLVDLLDKASRRDFTEAMIMAMEQTSPRVVDIRLLARDLTDVALRLSIAAKTENGTAVGLCMVATRV